MKKRFTAPITAQSIHNYSAVTQSATCAFLRDLCTNDFSFSDTPLNQQFALMAHYNFWDNSGKKLGFNTLEQSLTALKHSALQQELSEVITLLINRIQQHETDLSSLPNHAIKLHSRYSRQQILAAFGAHSFDKKIICPRRRIRA